MSYAPPTVPAGSRRSGLAAAGTLGAGLAASSKRLGPRGLDRLGQLLSRPWVIAAACVLSGAVLAAAGLLVHAVRFDRDNLPDLAGFVRFELPSTGRLQDARGEVLLELALQYRRVLRYDEIPAVLRNAILSAEDKSFFTHSGVDYEAFPRVLWKTLERSAGRRHLALAQGGSTVTQQLVRGYFLSDLVRGENTDRLARPGIVPRLMAWSLGPQATNKLLRKVEEMRLALWLEDELARRLGSKRRAKEEILARYASFVYLGNGRYGFDAAADYYFGRHLSSFTDADVPAAAFLAGLTRSPSGRAPGAPGVADPVRRRNEVLALMAGNGFLSQGDAGRFRAEPVRRTPANPAKTEAPAIVEAALSELVAVGAAYSARKEAIGVPAFVAGRIHVTSTADIRVQRVVNAALERGLALYEKRHPAGRGQIQGSAVVLRNSDAAILAEAGGRQVFRDRPGSYVDFNRARVSRRQPGSAMKPIVYLAALRDGSFALDDLVPDEPVRVPMAPGEPPKWISNYDGVFKGMLPLRVALAESRNAVAIWIVERIGIRAVLATAAELGIRTPLEPFPSTALGASEVTLVELANAYRAIASGLAAEPHVLEEVFDSAGRSLWRWGGVPREMGLPLRPIQEALRGVVRLPSGTAHSLNACRDFPVPVMGKTGTTNGFRDALFVGSTYGTGGITVAVRIGYDDNRELGGRETGARAALPVFRDIVANVYREKLAGPVPPFPGSIERGIDLFLATRAAPPAGAGPEPPLGTGSLPATLSQND